MNADGFGQADPGLETAYPLKSLTEKVIGAAIEVHNELGSGFLERVYELALLKELSLRNISAVSQASIPITYKGAPVGAYFADILVAGQLIVELKVADGFTDVHGLQVLHYLKATGLPVGLLLNFGTRRLGFKRFVNSNGQNSK